MSSSRGGSLNDWLKVAVLCYNVMRNFIQPVLVINVKKMFVLNIEISCGRKEETEI